MKGQRERIDSLYSCTVLLNALNAVDPVAATNELENAKKVAALLTATALTLVVVWTFLTVARFRVLRRRPARLLTDVVCMGLSACALVMFTLGSLRTSPKREHRFLNAPRKVLAAGVRGGNSTRLPSPNYVRYLDELHLRMKRDGACLSQYHRELNVTDQSYMGLEKRATLVRQANSSSQLHAVGLALSAISAILLLISMIAAVLAVRVRSAPPITEDTHRRWQTPTAPPAVSPGRGAAYYAQFVRPVPPPDEGVVLDRREGSDCRICAEVLFEDIAKLTTCQHAFHRKCILSWLVEAEEPACPLCKEPVVDYNSDGRPNSNGG